MSKMSNSIVTLSILINLITVLLTTACVVRFFVRQRKDNNEDQLKTLAAQFSCLAGISLVFAFGIVFYAVFISIRLRFLLDLPLWQVAGLFGEGMSIALFQLLLSLLQGITALVLWTKVYGNCRSNALPTKL